MRYLKYIILISTLALAITFLNDNGMIALTELQDKSATLARENHDLQMDIESLERTVGKLRTDPRTIELAANRKLGMIRHDETIYVFKSHEKKHNKPWDLDGSHLAN
ncbi:MAG: septum formation initiator family protein [Syntrophaceae bacterium]|nr:septum formation initiator family protein [Syntrophaceae bacterium]